MLPALAAYPLPLTGDLARDVDEALRLHDRRKTREHVPRVAWLAGELAARFGVDPERAVTAALLHDIGGIVPRGEMVALCGALGLEVTPEEQQVPMLLHQKLSAVLAREVYGVTDAGVVQAIRFHTALHGQPSDLDLVVFLADKLEITGVSTVEAQFLNGAHRAERETEEGSGLEWS